MSADNIEFVGFHLNAKDLDFARGDMDLPLVRTPATESPVHRAVSVARPAQVWVQPDYLKDYVTNF